MDVPPADELAEMIRAGCKVGSLAREYGVQSLMLLGHLYRGGYASDGLPVQKRPAEPKPMHPAGLARLVQSWQEPWMRDAACARVDPELWFPEKGGNPRVAREICAACPVVEPCLQYALANNERFGLWGNMSERERRRLAKERAA